MCGWKGWKKSKNWNTLKNRLVMAYLKNLRVITHRLGYSPWQFLPPLGLKFSTAGKYANQTSVWEGKIGPTPFWGWLIPQMLTGGRSLIFNQQMPKYCSGWERRGKTSYRTTHDSFYNIHGLLAAPLQDRIRHCDPCFLNKFSISYKQKRRQ